MPGPLDWLTQQAGGWGQHALDAADYLRYGTGSREKLDLARNQMLPGAPAPYLPTGEDSPSARRYASAYLAAERWGPGMANAANFTRYLLDGDPDAFVAGQQAVSQVQPTAGQQGTALGAMALPDIRVPMGR